jgi:hypothetical protein
MGCLGSPSAPRQSVEPSSIVVTAPVHELLSHYLNWAHHHPGVFKRDPSGNPEPINIPTAYIELFSPSGASLYRGTSDKENAAFLQRLEHSIPSQGSILQDREYPTLDEYLGMLDELKPFQSKILSSNKYVLFATTYRNESMCEAQNEVLQHFHGGANLEIVEVDLRHVE